MRAIYDREVRKRKHEKVAADDDDDDHLVNPQVPPRAFLLLSVAKDHVQCCAQIEEEWQQSVRQRLFKSQEPRPNALATFSNNKSYKAACEGFRVAHMKAWAQVQEILS